MSNATVARPSSAAPNPIDFTALKTRQQATWSSGNFAAVAARIVYEAEHLCEAADVQAGQRVLDVATGSGNAALAAARRGCHVVGVDYVPALLEHARRRATTEMLDASFQKGDAEDLPFPDASFDVVTSIYGCMFAPDHRKVAAELSRVCRSGGKIALACWTPEGYIGEMFRVVSHHVPPPPGLPPAVRWGEEAYLREIFGSSIGTITSHVRTAVFRDLSAENNIAFFRKFYGPTLKTFEAAPDKQKLASDMADLIRKFDRNDGKGGPIAITADYLETVIVKA